MMRIAGCFKDLKIQYKLIAIFMVLIIVPFSVLGILSYYKSSDIIMKETMNNSNQIVRQIADKIEYNMMEMDKNVLLFLWGSQIQNILKGDFSKETLYKRKANQMELEAAIQTFLNTRLEIESVYIYRADGDEYFIDDSPNKKDIRKRIIMKRWDIMSNAEKLNGKNYWMTWNLDKGMISSGRTVYDTINLTKLGLIIVNIQEKYFKSIYDGVHLSPTSFFVIRDKAGEIISTNSSIKQEDIYKILSNMSVSRQRNMELMSSSSDRGRYFIVSEVCDFTGWEVLGVIPQEELLGGIFQIGSWILFIGLVCGVISTILLLLLSSYILQPIKRLTRLMKRVEQEDFSVKAEAESKDELGELTVVFNKMIEKIRYLIEEVYQQKIVKQEAEFKLLQAQINPHFLYNTLDSINWIAKMNGVEDISRMVVALGQLMRISVSKAKKFMTLEQELEYINNYLVIQGMRYRDKFRVNISIPDSLKKCIVPKLMLQPIVENALVHGIEKKLGKGIIYIKAAEEEGGLSIDVADDGVGMDRDTLCQILKKESTDDGENTDYIHTGLGIHNVDKRIKMMYGGQYGLKIKSDIGKGTEVRIFLPIRYESKEA